MSDETLRQMRRGTGAAASQGKDALVPWSRSGQGTAAKSGPVGPLQKDTIIRPVSDKKGDYIPTPEQALFMAQMRQMLYYNQDILPFGNTELMVPQANLM